MSPRGEQGPRRADERPNIVLIMTDDQGYADASCYGSDTIHTPRIDRLAREGLRFTDFHSGAPVCTPTRAGLLTGRYQQRAGLSDVIHASPDTNRHIGLQPEEVTLAECLQRAGYHTGMFGKWHLGHLPKHNPVRHGFDEFRGFMGGNVDYFTHVDTAGYHDWWDGLEQVREEGYVTDLLTRHAVDFIRSNRERPFFLYVPHEAPHNPWQAPFDEPIREVGGEVTWESPPDPRKTYRVMVEEMDRSVGAIVDALEEHDVLNTFVFFCSDNGANRKIADLHNSNGDLRGDKADVWEGGHRVPGIAWYPGRIKAGRETSECATTMDLMPTILSVAGAQGPTDRKMDGMDLSGLLFEGRPLPERSLVWDLRKARAVRRGPWKLVEGERGQKGPGLFNMAEDYREQNDLAAANPDKVSELQEIYARWKKDVEQGATVQPDAPPQPFPPPGQ